MVSYIQILLDAVILLSKIVKSRAGLPQEHADTINSLIENLEKLVPIVEGTSNKLDDISTGLEYKMKEYEENK